MTATAMGTATMEHAIADLGGLAMTATKRCAPTVALVTALASTIPAFAPESGHLMIAQLLDAKTTALETDIAVMVLACVVADLLVLTAQSHLALTSAQVTEFARTVAANVLFLGPTLTALLRCVVMLALFPTESATMEPASAAHIGTAPTAKSQFASTTAQTTDCA